MFISRIRAPFTKAEPVGQSYFSDIHLGCPEFQEGQLKSDLQEAADYGDRIIIGGDTFDAILPSDKKRYKPESVHPRLYGTSKILDDQVDWAEEIFAPFADHIDGFGLGNHETAVEKHHASDLSARLIRRVQSHVTDKKHRIHYLGYIGFLDYRFERGKQRSDCKVANNTRRLVVFYHHGAGGQAPITKGMIDFNRKQTWVNSDVIWLQHKHNNVADTGAMRLSCPMKGLEPVARPQVCFMTPSYMKTYGPGRGGYASDWGLSPTNNGYARLLIDLSGDSGIQRIRLVH